MESTPVFDWSAPRPRKLSLFSFIAASAALHALCFYLFQIIYPSTVALLPPPARVNLIAASSEEGRLLLRWIESEDPALSSMTQRPADATSLPLPSAPHIASYANWQPVLRELPPLRPDLSIPSAQPPGPVPTPSSAPRAAAQITPTTLRFAIEVQSLAAPAIPPLQFAASRGEIPQAAQFRVALGPDGVVRYCFLQSPSGDPALDEQARQTIILCRFGRIEGRGPQAISSLLWTTATVEWGNDIAPPAASASPPPGL